MKDDFYKPRKAVFQRGINHLAEGYHLSATRGDRPPKINMEKAEMFAVIYGMDVKRVCEIATIHGKMLVGNRQSMKR